MRASCFCVCNCAVAVRRIREGIRYRECVAEEVDEKALRRMIAGATTTALADKPLSEPEVLSAGRCILPPRRTGDCPSAINADDEEALVRHILDFINTQYNYNLLNDKQLHATC